MIYVALNINGWLNGTVCRFLTKAEKSIWGDFIALGGDGEGRIGYIEEYKYLPYSRDELLKKCHCYSPEDIAAFDGCYKKCLEGVTIGATFDEARITLDEYGCIKIENWDTYQHSDYKQGYTEAENKEMIKLNKEVKVKEKLPTETAVGRDFAAVKFAKEAAELMEKAKKLNPELAIRTEAQYKAELVHNKGGNYLEGTKTKMCKCNICGKKFKLPIEKDEFTEVVGGLIMGKTCNQCRNDQSLKKIQPKKNEAKQ